MAEPKLSMNPVSPDDDLPRTFRREKEARERQAREAEVRSQRETRAAAPRDSRGQAQSYQSAASDLSAMPDLADRLVSDSGKVTVGAFDVPFMHMARFFLKAVFAAIPALILLFVVLWGIGQIAQTFMPWLVKLRVLVTWQ